MSKQYEVEIITNRKEVRRTYSDLGKATKAYHNAVYQQPEAEIYLHDLESGNTLKQPQGSYDITVWEGEDVHHDSCTSGMSFNDAIRTFRELQDKHPDKYVTIGRDPEVNVGE